MTGGARKVKKKIGNSGDFQLGQLSFRRPPIRKDKERELGELVTVDFILRISRFDSIKRILQVSSKVLSQKR